MDTCNEQIKVTEKTKSLDELANDCVYGSAALLSELEGILNRLHNRNSVGTELTVATDATVANNATIEQKLTSSSTLTSIAYRNAVLIKEKLFGVQP